MYQIKNLKMKIWRSNHLGYTIGFLWQRKNPYSKPMALPTRFFLWFYTLTYEKLLFHWMFMQRAWVYQCMNFDQIPEHPTDHILFHQPDIIFTNIQMPRQLRRSHNKKQIFYRPKQLGFQVSHWFWGKWFAECFCKCLLEIFSSSYPLLYSLLISVKGSISSCRNFNFIAQISPLSLNSQLCTADLV